VVLNILSIKLSRKYLHKKYDFSFSTRKELVPVAENLFLAVFNIINNSPLNL
jgi:hypothetical protein